MQKHKSKSISQQCKTKASASTAGSRPQKEQASTPQNGNSCQSCFGRNGKTPSSTEALLNAIAIAVNTQNARIEKLNASMLDIANLILDMEDRLPTQVYSRLIMRGALKGMRHLTAVGIFMMLLLGALAAVTILL